MDLQDQSIVFRYAADLGHVHIAFLFNLLKQTVNTELHGFRRHLGLGAATAKITANV